MPGRSFIDRFNRTVTEIGSDVWETQGVSAKTATMSKARELFDASAPASYVPPAPEPAPAERLDIIERAVRLPAGSSADAPIQIYYAPRDIIADPLGTTTGRWRVRDEGHSERFLATRAAGIPDKAPLVWNDTLDVIEALAKPYQQRIAGGRAVLNNLTAVASSDLVGFSGITRVAIGRYRFTFSTAQLTLNFDAIPFILDTTAVVKTARIFAKTLTYVEIGVNSLATNFPAADPTEVGVVVERNIK
jgi:hypothetical protein